MATINQLRAAIETSKGRFFSVQFVKADGSLRNMTCRKGVTKYLKGGVSTTKHLDHIVTVYDVQKKGYRNINLNTVKQMKLNGLTYTAV